MNKTIYVGISQHKKSLNIEASQILLVYRYLRCFKGARLPVFISLLIHSDDHGWTATDVGHLERKTGYSRRAIENALSAMCRLKIGNRRILLAVAERKRAGINTRNHFLLFPTETDIARYETMRCQIYADQISR